MIVTPELMRACGSGANPNDTDCVEGYNFFYKEYKNHKSDTPVTLAYVIARFKFLIDKGEIERAKGLMFLRWVGKLKTNPVAIRLGGEFKEINQFMFDNRVFDSLEEAKIARGQKVEHIRANPFEYVNVLRHFESSKGLVTLATKHRLQISESSKISIFDSNSGIHTYIDVESLDDEVGKQLDEHIKRVPKIHRKIIDTREGYEAWETVYE